MMDPLLGGASLAAAVAAVATYVWLVVRRAQMIRLFTGLGLFLTGLALFQGPAILDAAGRDLNVRLAVAALILAVAVQIGAALRTRSTWSGVERRTGTDPT